MDSNPFDQFDTPASEAAPPASSSPPSGSGNVTITPVDPATLGISPGASPIAAPAAPTPAASSSANSGPNPFDQFDVPQQSATQSGAAAPQPSIGTLIEAPFVGFDRGLADTLGAPVDAVNWGMGKLGLPTSQTPFMGSNFLKQSMGLIGANPDTRPPLTPAESVLQGAGEGAASVMIPEAGVGAIGDQLAAYAPKTANALESAFGSAKTLPAALGNAGVGAASGFGTATADQLPIPDQWKPMARMGAGLVGGGIGAVGAQVPTLAREGMDAARNFIQPMLKSGPAQIAGSKLAAAAGGKDTLLNAIQDNPGTLVPGSAPTLAEQTQIPGISSLQHQFETQNGVPFQERRAAQNQARVSSLTGLQPNGSPEDVASFLRTQLADLDQQAEGVVTQRTGAAQSATGQLGGTARISEVRSRRAAHWQNSARSRERPGAHRHRTNAMPRSDRGQACHLGVPPHAAPSSAARSMA